MNAESQAALVASVTAASPLPEFKTLDAQSQRVLTRRAEDEGLNVLDYYELVRLAQSMDIQSAALATKVVKNYRANR